MRKIIFELMVPPEFDEVSSENIAEGFKKNPASWMRYVRIVHDACRICRGQMEHGWQMYCAKCATEKAKYV